MAPKLRERPDVCPSLHMETGPRRLSGTMESTLFGQLLVNTLHQSPAAL